MNRNLLRAEMVKSGMTQEKVAKAIGMSTSTFSRKMKNGVFGTDEAEKMINLLEIKNPCGIFFGQEVT